MDYEKIYKRLCRSRKCRGIEKEEGYEIHHILPRSLGGYDGEDNLVKLTLREHYLAHKLLPRFLRGMGRYKMLSALRMMDCLNSKDYAAKRTLYKLSTYKFDCPKGHFIVNPFRWKTIIDIRNTLSIFKKKGIKGLVVPRKEVMYPARDGLNYYSFTKNLSNLAGEGLVTLDTNHFLFKVITFTELLDNYLVTGKGFNSSDYLFDVSKYPSSKYVMTGSRQVFNGCEFKNPPTSVVSVDLSEFCDRLCSGYYAESTPEKISILHRDGILKVVDKVGTTINKSQSDMFFDVLVKGRISRGVNPRNINKVFIREVSNILSSYSDNKVAIPISLFGISRHTLPALVEDLKGYANVVEGRFFREGRKTLSCIIPLSDTGIDNLFNKTLANLQRGKANVKLPK